MERKKIYIALIVFLLSAVAFMTYDTGVNLSYDILNRFICLGIMIIVFLLSAVAFMTYDTGVNLSYVIPKRFIRLGTMIIVASSIAYSSLIFQTLTQNKILTPSIMGYESVFILLQTIIVFIYGDKT